MVNIPSTPEIITVNSEALQTQIRDLLPSQSGFGSELQASNVITPIIDLTATAEGSGLPTNLQNALAYGSQTTFLVSNTTTTLAASAGFWRVTGLLYVKSSTTGNSAQLDLTRPSASNKSIAGVSNFSTSDNEYLYEFFDLIVWLTPGDTLEATSSAEGIVRGSYRQVATSDGTLVQPSGFPS